MSAIESVRDLHRSKLVERHEELFAEPPPRGISQPLLARIVAYETQAITHGGLPLRTRKRLQSVTQDQALPESVTRLKKDARLVRDWNGVSHVVDVVPGGFTYRDKSYRSLSAIAREITGARWSGPRFFGLQDKS
jgi:hypothetical protein